MDIHHHGTLQTVSADSHPKPFSLLYGLVIFSSPFQWTETDSFIHSSIPYKSDSTSGSKGNSYTYFHSPHTLIIVVFHVLNLVFMLMHFVSNLNLYIVHKIEIFLLHSKKVVRIQGNQIVSLIKEYISGKSLSDKSQRHYSSRFKRIKQLCYH